MKKPRTGCGTNLNESQAGCVEAVVSHPVPLLQLGTFYRSIAQALSHAGFSALSAEEVLAKALSFRCSQCGVTIAGPDLAAALAGEKPTSGCRPALVRLSRSYCPTKDCPSFYGDLLFSSVPEVDWSRVCEAAATLKAEHPEASPTGPQRHPGAMWEWLSSPKGWIAAVVFTSLFGLAIWLSLLRAPAWSRVNPDYQANPATTFRP